MYRGERDARLRILARQSLCFYFEDHARTPWVEVFIPPRNPYLYGDAWSSIALPPKQVCYVDNLYNEVTINPHTTLNCLYKQFTPDGRRVVVGREIETVEIIKARFLLYERFCRLGLAACDQTDVGTLYMAFQASGLSDEGYLQWLDRQAAQKGMYGRDVRA